MHTGAFAAAGQRLADTDDSFSSAPRGILIGQIPQILRAKKFDGTRGGQRLDIWLEEIDKAIIVNPDVFRQWKGDATDRSIAEQSLPRKLADLAQVVVNNLSMRSGSASNVRTPFVLLRCARSAAKSRFPVAVQRRERSFVLHSSRGCGRTRCVRERRAFLVPGGPAPRALFDGFSS